MRTPCRVMLAAAALRGDGGEAMARSEAVYGGAHKTRG